jgi:hypothetical protein
VVGNGEIGSFHSGVNQKESLVLTIPILVPGRGLREALGDASRAEEEEKTEDAEESMRFH